MDTGLHALVAVARFHKLPAEPEQLAHQFGQAGECFSDIQLLQAAKALTLKSKKFLAKINNLNNAVLPAIAKKKDGSYFIVARLSYEQSSDNDNLDIENSSHAKNSSKTANGNVLSGVLIHDLRETAPQSVSPETFEQLWSGELIVLTRREGFGESLQQRFDISWFIPSLVKYRKLFGEVLIASFFLQLFALVTPLFFQVVMDKVLVHRGFTTLDVLAVGFFVVVVFEAFLGGFRNYLFSHTTNRVDMELGSRLFNHLLALPLSYFESRQVGQNVARVRELDTIRNFITGTALGRLNRDKKFSLLFNLNILTLRFILHSATILR